MYTCLFELNNLALYISYATIVKHTKKTYHKSNAEEKHYLLHFKLHRLVSHVEIN